MDSNFHFHFSVCMYIIQNILYIDRDRYIDIYIYNTHTHIMYTYYVCIYVFLILSVLYLKFISIKNKTWTIFSQFFLCLRQAIVSWFDSKFSQGETHSHFTSIFESDWVCFHQCNSMVLVTRTHSFTPVFQSLPFWIWKTWCVNVWKSAKWQICWFCLNNTANKKSS